MSQNHEEVADERQEIPMLNLADGSEVAEATVFTTMISLRAILREYGILGATDATYLAQGMQPTRSPFRDLRPEFHAIGIGQLAEDGSLILHEHEAAIIRNAVHLDPNDGSRFEVTSPLEPFAGFADN